MTPLEVVEVEEDQRHLRALALRCGEQLGAAVTQQPAIGQAGQRVEVGQLTSPVFGFLLQGNIEHCSDRCGLPLIGDRRPENGHRKPYAILANTGDLVGPALLAGRPQVDLLLDHGPLFGKNDVQRPEPVDQLPFSVAKQLEQKRIGIAKQAVLEKEYSYLRGFHRRAELRFLFVHRGFGAEPFADVDHHPENRQRLARRVNLDRHRIVAISHPTVGADQPVMQYQRGALPGMSG